MNYLESTERFDEVEKPIEHLSLRVRFLPANIHFCEELETVVCFSNTSMTLM